MSNKKQKVLSLAIVAVLGLALLLGVILAVPNGVEAPAFAADDRTPINLVDTDVLHWAVKIPAPGGVGDPTSSNLRDGRVYVYRYKDASGKYNFYYSVVKMDTPPNTDEFKGCTDWTLDFSPDVKFSIMRYRQAVENFTHEVEIFLGSDYTDKIKVSYDLEDDEVGKYHRTANSIGQYTAKAKLTIQDPYKSTHKFTAGIAGDLRDILSDRGIEISITSDGNSAVMTKVWYLVNFDNALLNGKESQAAKAQVEFTIPSWKFGEGKDIEFPWLYHGDAALVEDLDLILSNGDDSYQVSVRKGTTDEFENIIKPISQPDKARDLEIVAGWNPRSSAQTNDIVTFELKKDGVTVTGNANNSTEVRSRWSYFINQYMPVGDYTLTIHVKDIKLTSHKHWWDGEEHFIEAGSQETLYMGFDRVFNFSVTPGDMKINVDIPKTVDALNIIDVQNDYSALFQQIDVLSKNTSNFTYKYKYTDLQEVNTYWTKDDKNISDYFGQAPYFEYNLSRMNSGDYYESGNTDVWKKHITTPSTYKVFYMAKMKNYAVYPSMDDRYKYFYEVVVYQEVAKPTLNRDVLTYTGGELSVAPEEAPQADRDMSLYTWSGHIGTDVDQYMVTFTLKDNKHYKWLGEDFDVDYSIGWKIEQAEIEVPILDERVWRGYGSDGKPLAITPVINIPKNNLLKGTPGIFTVEYPDGHKNGSFTDAGEYKIKLHPLSTNYRFVKTVESNDTYVPDDGTYAEVTFKVTPANNSWVVNPRINAWDWNSYDRTKNLIEGASIYGKVLFSISANKDGSNPIFSEKSLDANGLIPEDAANELKKLEAGTYYLIAGVPTKTGDNWSALSTVTVEFVVRTATNSWKSSPNIIRWKYENFDEQINLITAEPYFGSSITFSILSNRGNNPNYTIEATTNDTVIKGLEDIKLVNGVVQGNAANILKSLQGGNNNTYWLRVIVYPEGGHNRNDEIYYNYSELVEYVEFHVLQANNYWVETPNIARWIDGEPVHLPTGEARWGTPTFVIYRENNPDYILYDSANGINKLKEEAKPGWHILKASVAGTDSYTALTSDKGLRFQIFTTEVNFWNTVPNIQSWTEGETVKAPVADAAFGEIVYEYYLKADYEADKENAQALAGAPTAAGEYVLVATALSPDYPDLVAAVNFTVYEKAKIGATTYIAIIAVLAVLTVAGIALTVVFAVKGKKAPKLATASANIGDTVAADTEAVSEDEEVIEEAEVIEEEVDEAPAIEPTYID